MCVDLTCAIYDDDFCCWCMNNQSEEDMHEPNICKGCIDEIKRKGLLKRCRLINKLARAVPPETHFDDVCEKALVALTDRVIEMEEKHQQRKILWWLEENFNNGCGWPYNQGIAPSEHYEPNFNTHSYKARKKLKQLV